MLHPCCPPPCSDQRLLDSTSGYTCSRTQCPLSGNGWVCVWSSGEPRYPPLSCQEGCSWAGLEGTHWGTEPSPQPRGWVRGESPTATGRAMRHLSGAAPTHRAPTAGQAPSPICIRGAAKGQGGLCWETPSPWPWPRRKVQSCLFVSSRSSAGAKGPGAHRPLGRAWGPEAQAVLSRGRWALLKPGQAQGKVLAPATGHQGKNETSGWRGEEAASGQRPWHPSPPLDRDLATLIKQHVPWPSLVTRGCEVAWAKGSNRHPWMPASRDSKDAMQLPGSERWGSRTGPRAGEWSCLLLERLVLS